MSVFKHQHALVAVIRNKRYRCQRCSFDGDLPEAIKHAVSNQSDMRFERLDGRP